MVKRGEIWLVALDPTFGSEIKKTRPCLVLSPDSLNRHSRVVTVAPLTSGSRPAPFRVKIQFQGVYGLVLPEQCRAVDKQRLIRPLGTADDTALSQVLAVLRNFYT
ncbi:mRNA interferase PemK [Aureimonas sp. SA4125]|uniref:type II toxin-antitoxin system PemK/MazF family toxin n=1 Tax=Aureimonas sp. SA4125 TaxID=2826993 RepID=UPI001CC3A1FE|nr:type II toxin-antitoxin system PemK/MazF family toxin [Aureimonas sp. SA4125]BDA86742.1 mRNA interferase PemK [Aureimonas sp. SA4125]